MTTEKKPMPLSPYLDEAISPNSGRIYGRPSRLAPSRLSPVSKKIPTSPRVKVFYVVPSASRPMPPPAQISDAHIHLSLILERRRIGRLLIEKSATLARLRHLIERLYSKTLPKAFLFASSDSHQDAYLPARDACILPRDQEDNVCIANFLETSSSETNTITTADDTIPHDATLVIHPLSKENGDPSTYSSS